MLSANFVKFRDQSGKIEKKSRDITLKGVNSKFLIRIKGSLKKFGKSKNKK